MRANHQTTVPMTGQLYSMVCQILWVVPCRLSQNSSLFLSRHHISYIWKILDAAVYGIFKNPKVREKASDNSKYESSPSYNKIAAPQAY